MKRYLKLTLVIAGLLTFIIAMPAVSKDRKNCTEQKEQETCNKGVTTFVLFRVIS